MCKSAHHKCHTLYIPNYEEIFEIFFLVLLLNSVSADDGQMLLRQWESVLRDGTATPSESQGASGASSKGRDGSGEGGASGRSQGGEGTTPENQQDANSDPEAPNDSSAEEESGEWRRAEDVRERESR